MLALDWLFGPPEPEAPPTTPPDPANEVKKLRQQQQRLAQQEAVRNQQHMRWAKLEKLNCTAHAAAVHAQETVVAYFDHLKGGLALSAKVVETWLATADKAEDTFAQAQARSKQDAERVSLATIELEKLRAQARSSEADVEAAKKRSEKANCVSCKPRPQRQRPLTRAFRRNARATST